MIISTELYPVLERLAKLDKQIKELQQQEPRPCAKIVTYEEVEKVFGKGVKILLAPKDIQESKDENG